MLKKRRRKNKNVGRSVGYLNFRNSYVIYNMLSWLVVLFVVCESNGNVIYPNDIIPGDGEWTRWSKCNILCGQGSMQRYRNCNVNRVERDVSQANAENRDDEDDEEFGFELIHTSLEGRKKILPCSGGIQKETKFCTGKNCTMKGSRRKLCPPLKLQTEEIIQTLTSGVINTRLTFECKENYVLVGANNIICSKLEDGSFGWRGSPPKCFPVSDVPYHCSFDNGMCNMKQNVANDFHWLSKNTSTGNYPSFGNLDGNLSINGFKETINAASIETPWLRNSVAGYCVKFEYQMNGLDVKYLRVFLRISKNDGSIQEMELWEKKNDNENAWLTKSISILVRDRPVKIIFEAMLEPGIDNSIILDDITIDNNVCFKNTKQASRIKNI